MSINENMGKMKIKRFSQINENSVTLNNGFGHMKRYSEYQKVNEDISPNFFDYGYYDMANGQPHDVIEYLKANNITYTYDPRSNYIEVEAIDTDELISKMKQCDISKIEWEDIDGIIDTENPGDCLLLRRPSPVISNGAYM